MRDDIEIAWSAELPGVDLDEHPWDGVGEPPAMIDPRVRAALDGITDVDLRLAARSAVESLCWDVLPIGRVRQLDLQELLWRNLHVTWIAPNEELREIPEALAQLYDNLGNARYAALCRGEVTQRMFDEWARAGDRRAHASYVRELERSGVLPIDTDAWRWSGGMGMVETTLHDACSDMLEAAVVDGRLAPGSTRLKTAQRRLIDQWLDDPLPEDDEGRSPRELIEWERLKRWLGPHPGGPARSIPPDVRARLGELFSAPTADPSDELVSADRADAERARDGDDLFGEAIVMLLECAAQPAGMKLTQTGRLPRAYVRAVFERMGWLDDRIGSVNGESDARSLGELRKVAIRARLVRRRGAALHATKRGKELLAQPRGALVQAVLEEICSEPGFDAASMQVALALLAVDDACPVDELRLRYADAIHDGGWRPSGSSYHERLEPWIAGHFFWAALHVLDALGVAFGMGRRIKDGTCQLTPRGRSVALAGLRSCALGPTPDPRLQS